MVIAALITSNEANIHDEFSQDIAIEYSELMDNIWNCWKYHGLSRRGYLIKRKRKAKNQEQLNNSRNQESFRAVRSTAEDYKF